MIGEGPSRGLLRDYEPSDGTFLSTNVYNEQMHSTEIGCNFDSSITIAIAIETSVNGVYTMKMFYYTVYHLHLQYLQNLFTVFTSKTANTLRKSDNSR